MFVSVICFFFVLNISRYSNKWFGKYSEKSVFFCLFFFLFTPSISNICGASGEKEMKFKCFSRSLLFSFLFRIVYPSIVTSLPFNWKCCCKCERAYFAYSHIKCNLSLKVIVSGTFVLVRYFYYYFFFACALLATLITVIATTTPTGNAYYI